MRIDYTVQGGIGRISLVNPPHNTLTRPDFADPGELRTFLEEPTLRAVIVAGAGRHFSAGADVGELRRQAARPRELARALDRGKFLLDMISGATVPVLALIRGSCLGAGLEIALACHFRFAAATAMIGFPETEHGLMPGLGGSVFAAEIPRGALVELILSGRLIGAPEALTLGLVDRVAPAAELEKMAANYLDALTAGRPPRLIRAVMEAVHNGRRLPVGEALRRETELFCRVVRGDG